MPATERPAAVTSKVFSRTASAVELEKMTLALLGALQTTTPPLQQHYDERECSSENKSLNSTKRESDLAAGQKISIGPTETRRPQKKAKHVRYRNSALIVTQDRLHHPGKAGMKQGEADVARPSRRQTSAEEFGALRQVTNYDGGVLFQLLPKLVSLAGAR